MSITQSEDCCRLCSKKGLDWNSKLEFVVMFRSSIDQKLQKIYAEFRDLVLSGKLAEAQKLASAHHIHPDMVSMEKEQNTPDEIFLMGAMTRRGDLQAMKLLLNLKSDVHCGVTFSGAGDQAHIDFITPPLFVALSSDGMDDVRKRTTVEFLLERGADPLRRRACGSWLVDVKVYHLSEDLFVQLMDAAPDLSREYTLFDRQITIMEEFLEEEDRIVRECLEQQRPPQSIFSQMVLILEVLVCYGAPVPDAIVNTRAHTVFGKIPKKYMRHKKEILAAKATYNNQSKLNLQVYSNLLIQVLKVSHSIANLVTSYIDCQYPELRNRIAKDSLEEYYSRRTGKNDFYSF